MQMPFYQYDELKFEQALILLCFQNTFSNSHFLKRCFDCIQNGLEIKNQLNEVLQMDNDTAQSILQQIKDKYLCEMNDIENNQQQLELKYSQHICLNNLIFWLHIVINTAMQEAGEQQDFLLRENVYQGLSIVNSILQQHNQLINEQYIPQLAMYYITDFRFRQICFRLLKNICQHYPLDMFQQEATILLINESIKDITDIDLIIHGTDLFVTLLAQLHKKYKNYVQGQDINQMFSLALENSKELNALYKNMLNIIEANVPEEYAIHNIITAFSYTIMLKKDFPIASIVQQIFKRLNFNEKCEYRLSALNLFSQVALTQQVSILDNKILIDNLLSSIIIYINQKKINTHKQPNIKNISLNEIQEICILLTNLSCNQQCLETICSSEYMTIDLLQKTIYSTVYAITDSFILIAGEMVQTCFTMPVNEADFYNLMISKTKELCTQCIDAQNKQKTFTLLRLLEHILDFWSSMIQVHGRDNEQYKQIYELLQNYTSIEMVRNYLYLD